MKHVTEMNGPKSTNAWALLFNGKPAGKMVANWSNNPAGTVCSASVYIWNGPLDLKEKKGFDYGTVGKAGGYGYDKLSQAVWQVFNKCGVETKVVKPGNGQTREEFEAWGYEVIEVI